MTAARDNYDLQILRDTSLTDAGMVNSQLLNSVSKRSWRERIIGFMTLEKGARKLPSLKQRLVAYGFFAIGANFADEDSVLVREGEGSNEFEQPLEVDGYAVVEEFKSEDGEEEQDPYKRTVELPRPVETRNDGDHSYGEKREGKYARRSILSGGLRYGAENYAENYTWVEGKQMRLAAPEGMICWQNHTSITLTLLEKDQTVRASVGLYKIQPAA
ncbi:hypothetical protein BGZ63DRAFT_462342 [Mariannaea sp. PMI_226]|nr:hypothetical protein BGZ63DRAFT_462342 [Mariannaea sp. PMI_226]